MNTKRTTTVLGATIVGIGLVFGLIFTMPGLITEEVDSTAALMGSAIITITNPDGTTKYMQTDNQIQTACLSSAAHSLLGTNIGAQLGPYTSLSIYQGVLPALGAQPTGILNAQKSGVAYTTFASSSTSLTINIDFGTVTLASNDNPVALNSVGLTNGIGSACSVLDLATCPTGPGCGAGTGSTIVIDYRMTFT